jgi:type II secretory pathway component PulF
MPLFENAEAELPIATKALIATSDFVKTNFLLIVLFFFSIFVFYV